MTVISPLARCPQPLSQLSRLISGASSFLPPSFSGLLLHGPLSWIPNCIIPCDEACPDAQPCPLHSLDVLMQKSSRKRKNDYGYWHDKCSLAIFTGRGYRHALRGEDTEAQHSPGAKQPRSDDLQSCPRDHSYTYEVCILWGASPKQMNVILKIIPRCGQEGQRTS